MILIPGIVGIVIFFGISVAQMGCIIGIFNTFTIDNYLFQTSLHVWLVMMIVGLVLEAGLYYSSVDNCKPEKSFFYFSYGHISIARLNIFIRRNEISISIYVINSEFKRNVSFMHESMSV